MPQARFIDEISGREMLALLVGVGSAAVSLASRRRRCSSASKERSISQRKDNGRERSVGWASSREWLRAGPGRKTVMFRSTKTSLLVRY